MSHNQTGETIKTQNLYDKTITLNTCKKTQITGQLEPLWKQEVKYLLKKD